MKRKDGFISIEAVISMSAFLIFLILGISFVVYQYPKIILNQDVYQLSVIANEQGGLTTENIEQFTQRLKDNYNFINNSEMEVTVTLKDENGNDYTNVTPLNISGNNYAKRNDLKVLNLTIVTPSNNEMINVVLLGLGNNVVSNYYEFRYPVLSKRY